MKIAMVVMMCMLCWSLLAQAQATKEEKKPAAKPPAKPNPAFGKITEDPALPRVFLIGDSISIGYTIPVRKLLQGQANVLRPAANCGRTTVGLDGLDKWLNVGKLDVIHFNFGLHDLLVPPGTGKPNIDIKSYEENLHKVVARLKETGAKLIWATTTAVVDGPGKKRQNKDVIAYNEVALRVMKAEGIPVDDLFTALMNNPDREKITTPDGTHFTPEGYDFLAKQVAGAITDALK
jgi:acyl-CoA thioesterase-1